MAKKKRKPKKLYAKWWYKFPSCYGTWGKKKFVTWGERGWARL